jgi:sodium/proline symporter
MALRDHGALRRGRAIAIGWAALIYGGMLLLGLCGRVLVAHMDNHEEIFFALTTELLPPVIAGVMIAAVLSAVMSTADSQLLVAASAISHDLRPAGAAPAHGLGLSRLVVVGISAVAVLTALFLPDAIFSRVLFAWHAVGSALGPLLLVRLTGARIAPPAILAAMAAGFGLTVGFYFLPSAPGDAVERLVPFAVALAIAMAGRLRSA